MTYDRPSPIRVLPATAERLSRIKAEQGNRPMTLIVRDAVETYVLHGCPLMAMDGPEPSSAARHDAAPSTRRATSKARRT